MIMFTSYIIVFSVIAGLILAKPIEDKATNKIISQDISIEEAFRQSEIILNRYFHLMKSDTDQLVHAMLQIILNNPISFPFVPHRALDIALKNMAQKIGQDDVDILVKPILLSIEQNAQNKSKQPSSYKLTDDVKTQIEDALDKFFQEEESTDHM
jgi:hypothetical protein